MLLEISEDCLDRWLNDFDEFKYDFLHYCQIVSKAHGYWFKFDEEALKIAHANWSAQHLLWKKTLVDKSTVELSHLKIMAIALFQLASVDWLTELMVYSQDGGRSDFEPNPDTVIEVQKDINGIA